MLLSHSTSSLLSASGSRGSLVSSSSSSSSLAGYIPRRKTRRLAITAVYVAVVFTASFQAVNLLIGLSHNAFSPSKAPSSVPDWQARRPLSSKMAPAWSQPPLVPVDTDQPTKKLGTKKKKPKARPQLPQHTYRDDGLLEANPEGRHPVYDLIENAEKNWDKMLTRQSKSLDEAVTEYKRRYKRSPPKGFDRWWDYVETNNVLLPDEYDQIHRDLEPFWAVDPEQLRERQSAHEGHVDSYTIGKSRHGPIFVVNATLHVPEEREMHLDGARRMIEVLKPVEKWIPPFRAVFNPHDNPNQLLSWQLRQRALDAIAAGKYLDLNNMQGLEGLGWLTACHPRSPARLQGLDLDHPPVPPPLADSNRTRTFIHAHLPAMDPCLHPAHLHTHGQFLSHHGGPGLDAASALLAPQWSYSTTPLHVDLRPAAPNAWVADLGGEDLEWDEKEMTPEGREGRLLWRGSNTGIYAGSWLRWGQSQRQRLVGMAEETEGTIALMRPAEGDATLGREYQLHMHGEDKGREVKWEVKEVERAKLAGEVLDVHFAGKPIQCAQEICDQMEEMFDWRSNMNVREAGKYKYVMDVDGNGWSSRFKRLITSNAVILKATVYPEWFSERIMPWVHYVPVQNDYSDLFDILTFFRGVPGDEGHTHHDALARRIAEKGKEWSMTMWRREDLTAYMFRMMLEYARLLSVDRNEMSFEDIEDESSW